VLCSCCGARFGGLGTDCGEEEFGGEAVVVGLGCVLLSLALCCRY
jgi:hypothetical protein